MTVSFCDILRHLAVTFRKIYGKMGIRPAWQGENIVRVSKDCKIQEKWLSFSWQIDKKVLVLVCNLDSITIQVKRFQIQQVSTENSQSPWNVRIGQPDIFQRKTMWNFIPISLDFNWTYRTKDDIIGKSLTENGMIWHQRIAKWLRCNIHTTSAADLPLRIGA